MPFEILGKYTFLTVKSALLLFFLDYLFYNVLLITSFTTGSGTFILLFVVVFANTVNYWFLLKFFLVFMVTMSHLKYIWRIYKVYLTIRRQARGFYRLIVGEGRSSEPTIKGDRNRERAV